MKTLTIRIPESLLRDLEELSREQHRPVSEIVGDCLRRYVAVERFKSLQRKTIPYAKAAGFLTDEDFFEAIS